MTPTIHKVVVGAAIIIILDAFFMMFTHTRTSTLPPPVHYINYGGNLCENAFQSDVHYENETFDHFTLDLHEGCFSGFVHLPTRWRDWQEQPSGDQTGWWLYIWFLNEHQPYGPIGPNDQTQLGSHEMVMRIQGHGKILFYTTGMKQ